MAITGLRLEDGADTLMMGVGPPWGYGFRNDIICTGLDVGSPNVRETVTDRSGVSGTIDLTKLTGARAVAIDLMLCDYPTALFDMVSQWAVPSRRTMLVIEDDEWVEARRMTVRGVSATSAHTNLTHIQRPVQLQFVAPDGYFIGSPLHLQVSAEGTVSRGRTYPATWPRTYPPAAGGLGKVAITNPGSAPSDQMVRMYGPCWGPRWTNRTTGETITFTTDLKLGPGEYVEVDTRNRTALLNSDPSLSRLNFLDFRVSSWWRIQPGEQQCHYHPVSSVDVGCAATTDFTPVYF